MRLFLSGERRFWKSHEGAWRRAFGKIKRLMRLYKDFLQLWGEEVMNRVLMIMCWIVIQWHIHLKHPLSEIQILQYDVLGCSFSSYDWQGDIPHYDIRFTCMRLEGPEDTCTVYLYSRLELNTSIKDRLCFTLGCAHNSNIVSTICIYCWDHGKGNWHTFSPCWDALIHEILW